MVVERVGERARRGRATVLVDEMSAKERQHERRASGAKQAPRRVLISQLREVVEVHVSRVSRTTDIRRSQHGGLTGTGGFAAQVKSCGRDVPLSGMMLECH